MKFHFHDWNKWSDPIPTFDSGRKQQWKTCKVCNKAKFRTLWWDSQSSVSNILEALRKAQEK
jgi:hypothetical protein